MAGATTPNLWGQNPAYVPNTPTLAIVVIFLKIGLLPTSRMIARPRGNTETVGIEGLVCLLIKTVYNVQGTLFRQKGFLWSFLLYPHSSWARHVHMYDDKMYIQNAYVRTYVRPDWQKFHVIVTLYSTLSLWEIVKLYQQYQLAFCRPFVDLCSLVVRNAFLLAVCGHHRGNKHYPTSSRWSVCD